MTKIPPRPQVRLPTWAGRGKQSTKVNWSKVDWFLATGLRDQGIDQERLATELLDQCLQEAGLPRHQIAATIATGYGRNRVRWADTTITEITCHAQGIHHLAPEARTIIEIGGQDSKVISLEEGGRVRDFSMNDRCAAGSGRFLEVVASRLGVDLATLGKLSCQSQSPAQISSMCVVFAETEIIGLLAEGVAAPDIAAGVQQAIASRIVATAPRSLQSPIYFTGGVALQMGMLRALESASASPIHVSPMPQFTGALGAAILASRQRPNS